MEIELGDRTLAISTEKLRRAQAAWRGVLVRKQLTALRVSYEHVVRETELSGVSLNLTWPADPIALPQFSRSEKPGLIITTTKRPTKRTILEHEPTKTDISRTPQEVASVYAHSETCSSSGTQCEQQLPYAPTAQPHMKPMEQHPQVTPIELQPQMMVEDAVGNKPGFGSSGTEGQRTVDGRVADENLLQEVEDGRQIDNQGLTSTQHTTGVWDSVDLSRLPVSTQQLEQLDKESLLAERNTIAMELVWIQQAIDSRKQYLRLRDDMSGSTT